MDSGALFYVLFWSSMGAIVPIALRLERLAKRHAERKWDFEKITDWGHIPHDEDEYQKRIEQTCRKWDGNIWWK